MKYTAEEVRARLGFVISDREPRILTWESGGCHPASIAECALWDALAERIKADAEPVARGEFDAEARSHARVIHDFPRLSAFFQKHALGSKLPVSCFACGHIGERTITHAELADVYVCKTCAERITAPPAQPAERDEMSPDFTDSARAAIAWVLYHHQGGSSPIGQPLRFALGMSGHERLQDWRIAEAKRWAEHYGATTEQFHRQPAERVPEGFIVVPLLNPEEMQALRRFAETAEDDESYDVPKEMMGVLSLHGAVTRGSRLGWYWLTDFGRMLLAAAQQADR